MEEKMQDLIERKEKLLKQLEEIEANINEEDLKQATDEELLEYIKLKLEVKKRIAIIEEMEKNI